MQPSNKVKDVDVDITTCDFSMFLQLLLEELGLDTETARQKVASLIFIFGHPTNKVKAVAMKYEKPVFVHAVDEHILNIDIRSNPMSFKVVSINADIPTETLKKCAARSQITFA